MGLGRFELPTSPLSGVRSNQLSYRPKVLQLVAARFQITCEDARIVILKACILLFKGGDPAARSRTATLLRLHPSHKPHRGKRPPEGETTYFWCNLLPWCDGRCVQDPGTYSPRHSDSRLLAIPTSWSRVADSNPDYDEL